MSTQTLTPTVAAALLVAGVASAALFLRKRKQSESADQERNGTCPVLCFGDSLTEGYHGVWKHPRYSPAGNPDHPAEETVAMRLHPYCLKLGDCLADAAGDGTPSRRARHAIHRAWNGWTADELLAMLRRELMAGPWRCCVILAGSNDVVFGVSVEETLRRIRCLWKLCDEAGVPVVVVPNPPAALQYHGWVNPGTAEGIERAAQRTKALIELGKEVEKAAAAEKRPCTPIIYQGDDECRDNDQYWDDCLHFSPAGSDKLGQLVFTAITAAGL